MVYTHHLVKIDCDHNFLMGPMKCSLTKSWQHLVTSCLKTSVSFSSKQKELHLCHDPLGPGIFLPSPWSKKKTHVAMIDLMVTCLIKTCFFFFAVYIYPNVNIYSQVGRVLWLKPDSSSLGFFVPQIMLLMVEKSGVHQVIW